MTRWLGFFELAALAALVFAAATSLAVAALWPWLRRALRRWHPTVAAHAALLAACAPLLIPVFALVLCLAPGLLGADHCPQHVEHAHLCLHHPALAQGGAALALLAALVATALFQGLRGLERIVRARRALVGLDGLRVASFAADVRLLATETPVSLAVGAFRPHVALSEGLVRALERSELAVVLEHERAHARRRDALRGILARACAWAQLPWLRRALLSELRLAAERACDEAAAQRVGDRLLVAQTILRVEKLARSRPAFALACAFGESDVAPRVEGLLAEPGPRTRGVRAAAAAFVVLGIAAADPLHHATEHVLSFLLALL